MPSVAETVPARAASRSRSTSLSSERFELPSIDGSVEDDEPPSSPSILLDSKVDFDEDNETSKRKATPGLKVKNLTQLAQRMASISPVSVASTHLAEEHRSLSVASTHVSLGDAPDATSLNGVGAAGPKKKAQLPKKEKSLRKLLFDLNGRALTLGFEVPSLQDPFSALVFKQTKVSEDGAKRCLCEEKLETKSLIFSYQNCSDLNVCKTCTSVIRDSASQDVGQMIDFTRRVHLVGASGIFSGRDPNSSHLRFRIRDPRPNWLQQMIPNPLGIKIEVLNGEKKVFLVVGAKAGK